MAKPRKYVTVECTGFSLGGGVDVYQGETLELPAGEADVKIAAGMVRDATPQEAAAYVTKKEAAARRRAEVDDDGDDDASDDGKATTSSKKK